MRGVYSSLTFRRPSRGGSSPHARGLPPCDLYSFCFEGIIPACAGFTECGRVAGSFGEDHPRMRGVYSWSRHASCPLSGSSPHARGLPTSPRRPGHDRRIIPACAGFTQSAEVDAADPQDHPRMRGVYRSANPSQVADTGSSPHARGLLLSRPRTLLSPGIIPACAGFTAGAGAGGPQGLDHPRMRGVYPTTPTRGSCCADHPRMRGVYRSWPTCLPGARGSSPHARGLPAAGDRARRRPRIIPACAGFTSTRW